VFTRGRTEACETFRNKLREQQKIEKIT